jgi:hypothetical protein
MQHDRWPRQRSARFNDVLFRLKTSDGILDPLRVFVTDKEFVKLYVRAVVGEQYNVPTIAVLKSVREAIDYTYPANCVIKPTHLCEEVIFHRGGVRVDEDRIRTWFASNLYLVGREANYRTLRPKVIVEPIVFGGGPANDYKVLCVSGLPRAIYVVQDRGTCPAINLYTTDWQLLPYGLEYPIGRGADRPARLGELLSVAAKLAENFDFVRVDFYANDEQVLVGEITNCTGNAGDRFVPPSAEEDFSRLLFAEGELPLA